MNSETANYSAENLLRAARHVLETKNAAAGVWPRAAAHLCRQALESGLAEFWSKCVPGVQSLPLRAQLLSLPAFFNDPQLSRQASYVWAALSNACHHHVYELAPTAPEILAWIDTVDAMLEGFEKSIDRNRSAP